MGRGDWFGMIAIFISAVVGLGGYLAKPTFVPAARARELRDIIAELRQEIADLKHDNGILTDRVKTLISECEFWRGQWRQLMDERQRPRGSDGC